jgi:hypothetical protein
MGVVGDGDIDVDVDVDRAVYSMDTQSISDIQDCIVKTSIHYLYQCSFRSSMRGVLYPFYH